MGGFSQELARSATSYGWARHEILEAHRACLDLKVTRMFPFAALLEEQWLLYRGLHCLPDLELALSPRLPKEAFEGTTVIYTDGSGTVASKGSGSGVAVYEPGRSPRFIAENEGLGTNNWAELLAIWRALKAVPDCARKLLIRSDSEYAIGSVNDRQWSPNKNVALIMFIRQDIELRRSIGGQVTFEHVDGHAGVEGNEVADRLASMGRKVILTPEPLFVKDV